MEVKEEKKVHYSIQLNDFFFVSVNIVQLVKNKDIVTCRSRNSNPINYKH